MKTIINVMILCLMVFTTTACITTGPTVEKVTVKPIYPPDYLLGDCEVTKPVSVAEYTKLTKWTDKEEILFNMLYAGNKNITDCNTRYYALRKWKEKNLKIYGE